MASSAAAISALRFLPLDPRAARVTPGIRNVGAHLLQFLALALPAFLADSSEASTETEPLLGLIEAVYSLISRAGTRASF